MTSAMSTSAYNVATLHKNRTEVRVIANFRTEEDAKLFVRMKHKKQKDDLGICQTQSEVDIRAPLDRCVGAPDKSARPMP